MFEWKYNLAIYLHVFIHIFLKFFQALGDGIFSSYSKCEENLFKAWKILRTRQSPGISGIEFKTISRHRTYCKTALRIAVTMHWRNDCSTIVVEVYSTILPEHYFVVVSLLILLHYIEYLYTNSCMRVSWHKKKFYLRTLHISLYSKFKFFQCFFITKILLIMTSVSFLLLTSSHDSHLWIPS